MDWQALSHGGNGALLAVAITAAPMWGAMIQCRASLTRWLQSPLLALTGAIVAALLAGALRAWLEHSFSIPDDSRIATIVSVATFLLVGYAAGLFLSRALPAEQHKRGTVIVDGAAARRQIVRFAQRGDDVVTLAGIAIPLHDETKHFKLIGTTGTGKSTAIAEVLRTALARGDRAVVADPNGGYRVRFFERFRGDLILNPFESESGTWSLFAEIEEPYDVDQLARALIPDAENASGREWRAYARTFLSALVRHCCEQHQDLAHLWQLLGVVPTEQLRLVVAGTPAQPFLDESNARMFGSIRSVAVSATSALECIASQRTTPLSVRQWVRTGKGVLFIPYSASQIAALCSVISAWMRLAIFEAMNTGEGDQRLWFIVDELDALGAIDGLKDALARLRKFGGRCVLGFQSIAQVSSIYGAGEAQTIVENCGNTLILHCSGSEGGGTSRFASRLIGEREVVRTAVSRSRRPDSWSSSTTTSEQHVTELAVMPSEIEQLPDLEGYLKFASHPHWLRVRVPLTD